MTESTNAASRGDTRIALRLLFEFVFPLTIAGCALLFPLLLMGMQTDYDFGISMAGLFVFSAVAFWPVPLLACLLFKSRRLRAALIWWGALFICWLMGRLLFVEPPIQLIPEPLNTIVFFLTGPVLLWAVILRGVFQSR